MERIHERYALYAELASGGMATVHLGRLLGSVGFARTVAIKRLRPQFAESVEFRKMFVDEARLAARVRHPNVVQTLDIVEGDGELFLVMDYVHGESLSKLLRACDAAHLPDATVVATIMAGILHGLQAAHEATSDKGEPLGLIHRDVSPQNILVGVDGVARVLDFGVAKAAGRLQTTQEGNLKGKLVYMAPEQLEGATTQKSDVYSAAVVTWEALTGKRLFAGDSEGAVVHRILKGGVEPPSAHRPGLPAAIDRIVLDGLRSDPAERFSSAREMALALERQIGVVPASVVGAWVQATCGEALKERAAFVAQIEGSSPGVRTDDVLASLVSDTLVDAPREDPSSLAASRALERTRSRRRPMAVVGVVAGVAAGFVGLAIGLGLRGARVGSASDTSASQALPSSAGGPSGVVIASPEPSLSPSSPSSPSPRQPPEPASATPPSAPPPSTSHPASPKPAAPQPRVVTSPRASPSSAAPVSCDPPYTLSEDGVKKLWKPECLK